jgi:two-component system response regulator YesN
LILFVFIIVVGISTTYYIKVGKEMEQQNIIESHNTIVLMKNAIESMLRDVDRSLLQITLDPAVENFAYWNSGDNRKIDETINFIQRINNSVIYNTYFSSVFIYYLNEDLLFDILNGRIRDISVSSNIQFNNEFDERDKSLVRSASDLYEKSNDKGNLQVYNMDIGSNLNKVTIVKSLGTSVSKTKGLLIITLDPKYFEDMMKGISEDSNFFIIDANNLPISSTNKNVLDIFAMQDDSTLEKRINQKEGSFTADIDEEQNLISFVTSEKYGWKFVHAISKDRIYEKINFLKLYFIIIALLCLFLGAFMSFILAGRLNMPIKRLFESVKNHDSSDSGALEDDISYIERNINTVITRNKSLEQSMNESMPVLRDSLIRSLLKNEISFQDNIWDKLTFYGAKIKPDVSYGVCMIAINDHEEIGNIQVKQLKLVDEVAIQYDEIAVEMIRMEENENEWALLVSLPYGENHHLSLFDFAAEVHQILTSEMDYTLTLGVSSIRYNMREIYQSYNEARSALAYKLIQGQGKLISITDIPQIQEKHYSYPFDIEKLILNCLKAGDKENLLKELDQYMEHAKNSIFDHTDMKYLFIRFMDSILKCSTEIALDLKEVFVDKEDLYKDLFIRETIADAHLWFEDFFVRIIDYLNEKRNDKTSEIVARSIQYIEQNYISPDLSLEILASEVGLSVSYLGKIFRDNTGQSIKEFITSTRIEKAKLLLQLGNVKIKEVGERVGYPNTGSFIHMFKKYEGETPGNYHDRMSK